MSLIFLNYIYLSVIALGKLRRINYLNVIELSLQVADKTRSVFISECGLLFLFGGSKSLGSAGFACKLVYTVYLLLCHDQQLLFYYMYILYVTDFL